MATGDAGRQDERLAERLSEEAEDVAAGAPMADEVPSGEAPTAAIEDDEAGGPPSPRASR